MSNDLSCANHDRRMFKGFCDPFIDAEKIGTLHFLKREKWMENYMYALKRGRHPRKGVHF